jgi:hypothetical protein
MPAEAARRDGKLVRNCQSSHPHASRTTWNNSKPRNATPASVIATVSAWKAAARRRRLRKC